MLVLDSGGVSVLATRDEATAAIIRVFVRDGLWPPLLPSIVLVECLSGRQRTDAVVNRIVKTCDVVEELPTSVARRAAEIRRTARRGSAVDAVLVAVAEPGGAVLTGDVGDMRALAG